jgi:hypothetical protein
MTITSVNPPSRRQTSLWPVLVGPAALVAVWALSIGWYAALFAVVAIPLAAIRRHEITTQEDRP